MSRREERIHQLASAAEQRFRTRRVRISRPPAVWPTPEVVARAPLWADDYRNMFRLLK